MPLGTSINIMNGLPSTIWQQETTSNQKSICGLLEAIVEFDVVVYRETKGLVIIGRGSVVNSFKLKRGFF